MSRNVLYPANVKKVGGAFMTFHFAFSYKKTVTSNSITGDDGWGQEMHYFLYSTCTFFISPLNLNGTS